MKRHRQVPERTAPQPTPDAAVQPAPGCVVTSLDLPRYARAELACVLLLAVTALALRLAWPSRLAVEHFDEGVYASNIFLPEYGFTYPMQHLYAPPLLPAAIEWVFVFGGPSNFGAMLVSILAGTLTVPLVWWTARRWAGPGAGLAACALTAFNDVHILFSRAALTDVLLTFWSTAAVALLSEAYRQRSWRVAGGAGVVTALAWWTKYNGWLPLAVGGAALAGGMFTRRTRAEVRSRIAVWGLAGVVAAGLWLPWLMSLQDRGGYAAVAANHRGYLVGPSGWWQSLVTQWSHLQSLDGPCTMIGMGLAMALARFPGLRESPRFTWNGESGVLALWVLACGLAAGCGSAAVVGGLALTGLVRAVVRTVSGKTSMAPWGMWLLAAWFLGLLVSTPLYSPYVRLTLPWLVASWLAAGCFLGVEPRGEGGAETPAGAREGHGTMAAGWRPPAGRLALAAGALVGVVLLFGYGSPLLDRGVVGWQSRRGLAEAAGAIGQAARVEAGQSAAPGGPPLCYVYGEPALVFQLNLQRTVVARPVAGLDFSSASGATTAPTFLVTGPHAERSPEFKQQLASAESRLQLISGFDVPSSRLVQLDQWGPDPPEDGTQRITLYRVK